MSNETQMDENANRIPDWAAISAVLGCLVVIISFGFAWEFSSAGATLVMSVGFAIAAIGFRGIAVARAK